MHRVIFTGLIIVLAIGVLSSVPGLQDNDSFTMIFSFSKLLGRILESVTA